MRFLIDIFILLAFIHSSFFGLNAVLLNIMPISTTKYLDDPKVIYYNTTPFRYSLELWRMKGVIIYIAVKSIRTQF